MQYKQMFFLGKELKAVTEVPGFRLRDQFVPPHGQAFFCPICSEVWAMAVVEGQPTAITHGFCDKHPAGEKLGTWNFGHVWNTDIPGSLWRAWDMEWNKRIPEPLLRRELTLTIRSIEEELKQGERNANTGY